MSKYVDAIGKACPMPVVLAKKAIEAGEQNLTVAVDNEIAVENLKRLAADKGIDVTVNKNANGFEVVFAGGAEIKPVLSEALSAPSCSTAGCGYAVFFGKDYVGEGDYTLGNNLAKMMLYTLSEGDDIPAYVIFMNSGVKIATSDKIDIINSLNVLIEKGTQVLVCGTCLNYYNLTEKLKVGIASNMYEIVEKMQKCAKVITV